MRKIEGEKQRNILGQGIEHTVFQSRLKPHCVTKIPRLVPYLLLTGQNRAAVLSREHVEAQILVEDTDIEIPPTSIRSIKRKILGIIPDIGYIIRQEYIMEDKSVPDILQYLRDQGLDSLAEEYQHEPRNFISREGVVYWIDPTKGVVGRILESLKIIKLEEYRKVRRRFIKVIRSLGL